MSRRKTFIDRALAGEVKSLREIDDDIQYWHEHDDATGELHEWLGLTKQEYWLWLGRSSVLPYILQARKHSIPIAQHLASLESSVTAPSVAAGVNGKEVTSLVAWLKVLGSHALPSRKRPVPPRRKPRSARGRTRRAQ